MSLKEAQPRAEGAAPHLVDYIEKLASALRQKMKRDFSDRLQKRLEQMKWPSRELYLADNLMAQWRDDVELLLDLQTPYVALLAVMLYLAYAHRELPERGISSPGQNAELPISFPLEVMVHPLELRFKYHFSGDKPTNRLDKVRPPPDGLMVYSDVNAGFSRSTSYPMPWTLSATTVAFLRRLSNPSLTKRHRLLGPTWNGISTMRHPHSSRLSFPWSGTRLTRFCLRLQNILNC